MPVKQGKESNDCALEERGFRSLSFPRHFQVYVTDDLIFTTYQRNSFIPFLQTTSSVKEVKEFH